MSAKNIPEGVSRGDLFAADPSRFTIVGGKPYTGYDVDTADGPEHPLYDERVADLTPKKLDSSWVANVALYGVKEPILVKEEPDGRLLVIAGRHRVAWGRAANELLAAEGSKLRHKVFYVKQKLDEKTAMGVMISENEIRTDDSIVAKARKVARLINAGYTIDETAVTFGTSKQTIRNYQTLVTAHGEVLKAVESGKIGTVAAVELAKLPREEQAIALAKLIEAGATAREAKDQIRQRKNGHAEEKAEENSAAAGYPRATVGDLRKIHNYLATDPKALNKIHAADFLSWQLGALSYKKVAGLASVLRAAGVIATSEKGAGADEE